MSGEAKSAGILAMYSEHFQRSPARKVPFEAAVSLCERAFAGRAVFMRLYEGPLRDKLS